MYLAQILITHLCCLAENRPMYFNGNKFDGLEVWHSVIFPIFWPILEYKTFVTENQIVMIQFN